MIECQCSKASRAILFMPYVAHPPSVPTGAEMISGELKASGWWLIPPGLATVPVDILSTLGPLIPSREGLPHRDLVPHKKTSAPHASMSATTGAGEQPMHTDAAYYSTSPRYIAFQCLEPGETSCPTRVWSLDLGRLREDRPAALTKTSWVAHGGGRPSSTAARGLNNDGWQ